MPTNSFTFIRRDHALWHGLFDFATASAVDQGTVAAVMSVLVMAWILIIVIDKLRAESFQRKVCRLAT